MVFQIYGQNSNDYNFVDKNFFDETLRTKFLGIFCVHKGNIVRERHFYCSNEMLQKFQKILHKENISSLGERKLSKHILRNMYNHSSRLKN